MFSDQDGPAVDVSDCVKILNVHRFSVRFGDGVVAINEPMTPFFSVLHNGICYAFIISPNITRSVLAMPQISVTFHIPQTDADKFENCFFMAQAIQITKLGDGVSQDPRDPETVLTKQEAKLKLATEKKDPVAEFRVGRMVKEVHDKRFKKSPKRKTD